MDMNEGMPNATEQQNPNQESTHKRSAAQRWVKILKIYFGACFVVCSLVSIFIYHEMQWPKPDGDFDTWDFGEQNAKEITVPFTSPDGLIHIRGIIGKRLVQFTVDTGASSSIIPKRLHLGTQYADDSVMSDATVNNIWTRPVYLSDVRIGDGTIHNLSAMVPDRRIFFTPVNSGSSVTDLTLGNTALCHVVVTIDYVKQLITFQPPQKQALPDLPKPLTSTRYTWPKENTVFNNGAPFISGGTNHQQLNVILDTGTTAAITIPASLKDILVGNKQVTVTDRKAKISTLFGIDTEEATSALTVSLYPDSPRQTFTITANADVANGWSDPKCILWGEDSLSTDIVTIDYPHRTVTIAPALAPHVSVYRRRDGSLIYQTIKTVHRKAHSVH